MFTTVFESIDKSYWYILYAELIIDIYIGLGSQIIIQYITYSIDLIRAARFIS